MHATSPDPMVGLTGATLQTPFEDVIYHRSTPPVATKGRRGSNFRSYSILIQPHFGGARGIHAVPQGWTMEDIAPFPGAMSEEQLWTWVLRLPDSLMLRRGNTLMAVLSTGGTPVPEGAADGSLHYGIAMGNEVTVYTFDLAAGGLLTNYLQVSVRPGGTCVRKLQFDWDTTGKFVIPLKRIVSSVEPNSKTEWSVESSTITFSKFAPGPVSASDLTVGKMDIHIGTFTQDHVGNTEFNYSAPAWRKAIGLDPSDPAYGETRRSAPAADR